MASVKFCGLTRAGDAAVAARLGARYVGVVMASGPRRLDPVAARTVLDGAGPGVRRVGVVGAWPADEIIHAATAAALDVVQLHGDPTPELVAELTRRLDVELWGVVRVTGSEVGARVAALLDGVRGVVLDAWHPDQLGGTGRPFDWQTMALSPLELGGRQLVVAGGLTPQNVGEAIALLAPDVVDVSSGVESSVGIKDHARMQAFMEAAAAERGTP